MCDAPFLVYDANLLDIQAVKETDVKIANQLAGA
jgi:hypothetical protein